jgi:hypothetical protein
MPKIFLPSRFTVAAALAKGVPTLELAISPVLSRFHLFFAPSRILRRRAAETRFPNIEPNACRFRNAESRFEISNLRFEISNSRLQNGRLSAIRIRRSAFGDP